MLILVFEYNFSESILYGNNGIIEVIGFMDLEQEADEGTTLCTE